MPRSSGSSNLATPALKQATFPGRRRNARLRTSMLGSEKEKRQSSLTQMDFGTPSNTEEIIDISSDSNDEEFQEPQPKKKQRLSKTSNASARKPTNKRLSMKLPKSRENVGESQNTFTQMGYMPSARNRKTKDEMEDDDEFGLNISVDEEMEVQTTASKRRKLFTPWKDQESDTTRWKSPQRDETQSDNGFTPGLPRLESPATRYNLRSPPKRAATPLNLASHSIATRDFTTPKKFAEVEEIPSSQTPASIKLSSSRMQRSQPRAGFQRSPLKDKSLRRSQPRVGFQKSPVKEISLRRSPLKEKSTNVMPQAFDPGSPESQNPLMKEFERIRHVIMQGAANKRAKAAPSKPSPLAVIPPPQPGPLVFAGTKQVTLDLQPSVIDEPGIEVDNMTEDLPNPPEDGQIATGSQRRKRSVNAEEATNAAVMPIQPLSCPSKRTLTVQDSQQESLSWPSQRPPRKTKRTNTIQDSQHEDVDMSSSIYRIASGETLQRSDFASYSDGQQNNTYSTMEPQTYDPAHAALDRDAARFTWTQTQMPVSRVADSVTGSPERIVEGEAEGELVAEAQAGEEYEDEHDLDRGIVPASDDEDDEVVMLPNLIHSTSQELGHDAGNAVEPLAEEEDTSRPTPMAIDHEPTAINQTHQTPSADPSSSPSPPSSPPVHPSQISTVVPTQSSPRRTLNNQPDANEDDSPPTSPPAPDLTQYQHTTLAKIAAEDPRRLPQSAVSLPRSAIMLSSSPLPLPPWTSSDRGKWGGSSPTQQKRAGTQAEEIESLQDFSLPPPPPMFRTSSPFNRVG